MSADHRGASVKWARGLSVETADPRCMSTEALQALYEFSNAMMQETFEAFINHVLLNDVVYLFRQQRPDGGSLVGFSCWRHVDWTTGSGKQIKIVIQGKLRILSSFRRIGLHVWATLWYWLRLQRRYPFQTIWFTAFVSLFNYVSVRKSIGEYYYMSGHYTGSCSGDLQAIHNYVDEHIIKGRYEVDEEDPCRINVKIKIPAATINEFPKSFFEASEAQEYISANPKFADGYDLSISYPFSLRNVVGLFLRAVTQTYWRGWSLANIFGKTKSE